MAEYRFAGRAPECAVTGKPFEGGESIVSAIFDEADGFVRRDFSEQAFPGPEGTFSVWKSVMAVKAEDPYKLDFELAGQFLQKLVDEADPEREGLIYVLTLLLSRKRRVKILHSAALPEGELLRVRIPGPEEDVEVAVRAPRLGAEAIERLQAEIARLFGFAAPEPEPEPPAAEK